jgi:Ribbon-Helix-Helix transcriptional regulator family
MPTCRSQHTAQPDKPREGHIGSEICDFNDVKCGRPAPGKTFSAALLPRWRADNSSSGYRIRGRYLEAARDAGTPLLVQVLGLATIASDVTPELARAAIASVQVLGAFHASPAVKAALADRTT